MVYYCVVCLALLILLGCSIRNRAGYFYVAGFGVASIAPYWMAEYLYMADDAERFLADLVHTDQAYLFDFLGYLRMFGGLLILCITINYFINRKNIIKGTMGSRLKDFLGVIICAGLLIGFNVLISVINGVKPPLFLLVRPVFILLPAIYLFYTIRTCVFGKPMFNLKAD